MSQELPHIITSRPDLDHLISLLIWILFHVIFDLDLRHSARITRGIIRENRLLVENFEHIRNKRRVFDHTKIAHQLPPQFRNRRLLIRTNMPKYMLTLAARELLN